MTTATFKEITEKARVKIKPEDVKPIDKTESQYKGEDYIKILYALGYQFRLCVLDDRVEINGEPITDRIVSEINSKIRDLGLFRVQTMADHYTRYAAENAYHPIQDYFKSLVWDGKDSIEQLSTYFKDTDNIFPIVLKRWLIGAVAKTFSASQNPMLVLNSEKQGIGKSFFAGWLCSFLPNRFIESAIDPSNKENEIRLITSFIWEVSELGASMRKADIEALKAFITKQMVTVRKPYGHYDITKPALANLIGTINNVGGFLNDPTGNRRFYTVNLTDIDHAYKKDVDINHVWAQAHALYKRGVSSQPTKEEQAKIFSVNERFEIEDPLVELMTKTFKINPEKQGNGLSTIEIIKELRFNDWKGANTEKAEAMLISQAATKLGLKKRIYPTKGYYGIEKIQSKKPY